jgi:hypothetical protein
MSLADVGSGISPSAVVFHDSAITHVVCSVFQITVWSTVSQHLVCAVNWDFDQLI